VGAVLDGGIFRRREGISLSSSKRKKLHEICQRIGHAPIRLGRKLNRLFRERGLLLWKKSGVEAPHFLSLNQDIVAGHQKEKCGLK
jgi:hypothetical protein